VRVKPGDTSKMATIMATNGGTAILVEDGAHHYRLIGLEVTINPQYTGWTYNLILLRPNSNTGFIYAQTPKHITLDRLYLHGRRNLTLFRAVYMDGEFLAAINCYASEIHVAGFDSQAMGGSNGGGPFKLTNNYLEASGENIMFGGTRTQTLDLMPQDIEIRGNYLYKPWTWKYDSGKTLPSTCFWDSSYGTSGENFELKDAAGNSLGWYQCSSGKWINRDITLPITKWTVKNLFELKNAQRVLVEGNVLQNNWQQAQNGIAVLYNGVDGNTSTIEHITFRNNIVLNAQRAVSASANAYSMQLRSTNTLLFENNFFKLFFPRDIYNGTEGGGIFLTTGVNSVMFSHNTVITPGGVFGYLGEKPAMDTIILSDNLTTGKDLLGNSRTGADSVLSYFTTNSVFRRNTLQSAYGTPPTKGYLQHADNVFLSSFSSHFVDVDGGDYRLSVSSPLRNAGTDGKDIGVDWAALNRSTAGAVAGTWSAAQEATFQTAKMTAQPSVLASSGGGGSYSVTIFAPPQCIWSFTSPADWVRLRSVAPVSGPARLSIAVDPNTTKLVRTATVTFGSATLTITQKPK
jgi:Putative binding domain, N-terminal